MERCATCRYWHRFERIEPEVMRLGGEHGVDIELPVYRKEIGQCTMLHHATEMIDIDHLGCMSHTAQGFYIVTHEEFGCVLHAAKDEA